MVKSLLKIINRNPYIFIVLILSILVSLAIAKLYIPLANVAWDESVHTMWGYRIYQTIRQGNLSAFWQTILDQFGYPPLQSLFFGIPLSFIGFSIYRARILGLFWLILGSLLVFSIGKKLGGKLGNLTGMISFFFYITSPLIIFHSSLTFIELMGSTITLITIIIYIKARETQKNKYYLLTSFMLFLLSMTKYNYGEIIAGAIFIEAIFHYFYSNRSKGIIRNYLLLYAPYITAFLLWIFFPTNKLDFFIFVEKNPWQVTTGLTNLIGYLLVYPRAIILMYSASIMIGFFLLFALAAAFFYLKDFRIRLLWIAIVLNIGIAAVHTNNILERYIFTIMPLYFILGGFVFTKIYSKIIPLNKNSLTFFTIWVLIILICGKIIIDLFKLPSYVYSVGSYYMKSPYFNQLDFRDLWFNYDTNSWPHTLPQPSDEKPADVVEYIANNVDLSKPVDIIGRANELPPDYFKLVFELHKEKNQIIHLPYSSFIATVEVLPTSRYYTADFRMFNEYLIQNIRQTENDKSLTLFRQKTFKQLGVKVGIYIRK